MADERNLKNWVSDKLMSLLGFTNGLVVQYVIRLSKESSSPSDLMGRLVEEYGFSSSGESLLFAKELFAKVPRKQSGPTNYQKEEKEAAILAKKHSSYKLLDADDEDDEYDQVPSTGVVPQHSKAGVHLKRFRKKGETRDSEDDEAPSTKKNERHVRNRTYVDNNENDMESEEAMMHDQEEREQLERNMRERDAAGTRKLMETKLSKEQEEEIIRRSKALEDDDTSTLRKFSRQAYLQKRRDQKLLEIKDAIIDHEYIFEGVKLTEAEERELRYKKKIYELAKERLEDVDNISERSWCWR